MIESKASVQRYELESRNVQVCWDYSEIQYSMAEKLDGDYIKYEDYEALVERYNSLAKEYERFMGGE